MLLTTATKAGCKAGASAAQVPQQRHSLPAFRVQRHAGQVTTSAVVYEDAPLVTLAVASTVDAPATTAAATSPPVDLPAGAPAVGPEVTQQAAEKVQELSGSVSQAAAGVTDKAAELAGAASKATSSVTASASKAAAGLTSAVSGATSSVTDTLSGLTSGVGSNLSGLTSGVGSNVANLKSSLGQGASSVASQVSSFTDSVGGTIGGTLSGLKSNIDQATSGVTGAVGQTLSQVTAATKSATDSVTAAVSGGQAAVQQTVEGVTSQVEAISSQVAGSVDAMTQQALSVLPAPVKDAVVAAGGVAAAAGGQVVSHPRVAAVVALALGVPTAYRYYKGRYGGYAGELPSDKVFDLLTNDDNVFLVDIRPEEQREKEGLPQLKLGARYKVAAFPVQVTIPPRVAREAVNADELRLLVNAAFIAGLPQCQGPLTKLVIMDSSGSDKARDLARALTSLGQPLSYVLAGGFKAWEDSELPVQEGVAEYDASTGAVLSDNVEVIAEKANEAVRTVTQPEVGLPLLGGSALGVYAALNIHTTLQYIGVLGVLLTIINKALSYDSPQAALDDAKDTLNNVQKTLSKLGSIKPPSISAPSLPTLPTMPGSKPAAAQAGGQPAAAAAVSSSSSSNAGGAAAGAALSAAAVAGGSQGGDVGDETEQELVD